LNVTIRAATHEDAEVIGELSVEAAGYYRALGDTTPLAFDAEAYLRDGFGPDPAFAGLVAEREGEIVGYLLYHPGYNIDHAARVLHVIDLYVREGHRQRGIGRALMGEAARICRQYGGEQLTWTVWTPNRPATAFYERLGAWTCHKLRIMELDV
jgi:ribosomal protein S18 acetylase RimI-like enzyme